MTFDKYGALYMEHEGAPNCYGDSCAETSRWFHLVTLINKTPATDLDLKILSVFKTDKGYIRHPEVPEDWKEIDFSSDQALPLYLAYGATKERIVMEQRLKNNGWRTGNGDIISPLLMSAIIRQNNKYLSDFIVLFQGLILKFLPFRWNDGFKRFESTKNSSGDYLNFIHLIFDGNTWINKLTRKLFTKEFINNKVQAYYSPEIDVQWLLDLYKLVIDRTFS